MSPAFDAIFWGFVSGGALVIGAAIGYFAKVPGKVVAGVMAFGSGVLISALSFELMEEAKEISGLPDDEFDHAYDRAAHIADKVLQHEGEKMDKFLEHFAEEIEKWAEHFGGKIFK